MGLLKPNSSWVFFLTFWITRSIHDWEPDFTTPSLCHLLSLHCCLGHSILGKLWFETSSRDKRTRVTSLRSFLRVTTGIFWGRSLYDRNLQLTKCKWPTVKRMHKLRERKQGHMLWDSHSTWRVWSQNVSFLLMYRPCSPLVSNPRTAHWPCSKEDPVGGSEPWERMCLQRPWGTSRMWSFLLSVALTL